MASVESGPTVGVVGVGSTQSGQPRALLRSPALTAGRYWMPAVCPPLG